MRILLLEDEPGLAAVIGEGLREEGYAVDVAATGDDAHWMLRATEYDAAVLDVMVPGRDGFQLCRELRDEGVPVPVLLLTARDAVEDRVTGLDAGADDYLTKPFHFSELFARVRALVRRGAPSSAPSLTVRDLVLDPATRTVTRAGQPIALSTTEFNLLATFMREPDRPLSRFHLLEHVWDGEADHASNVIDAHLKNLRAKLDRPFGTTVIETVRGVGYRLTTSEDAWHADRSHVD